MADIPICFGGGGGSGSDDVTATKNQVLAGYTAITKDSNDEPVEGTIPSKAAETFYPSGSDQTIAANQYTSGVQTIKAVTTTNISAANIKKGVSYKVGDDGDDDRIITASTGTYTTLSGSNSAATAAAIRKGYSAFVNGGGEIQGTLENYSGTTSFTPTAAGATLSTSGKYMTSNITINGNANLVAGNILAGKSIFGVAGSFYSGAQRYKTGTATGSTSTLTFAMQSMQYNTWQASTNYSRYYFTFSNLGFIPTYIYGCPVNKTTGVVDQLGSHAWYEDGYWYWQHQFSSSKLGTINRFEKTGNFVMTSSLIRLPGPQYESAKMEYYLG